MYLSFVFYSNIYLNRWKILNIILLIDLNANMLYVFNLID